MQYLVMNLKRSNFLHLLFRSTRYMRSSATNVVTTHNVKSLSKYLSLTESKAHYLCMKYPILTKMSNENLESLMNTVNELGFSCHSLIEEPTLFATLPVTLKFRYKVLNECGIQNITISTLSSYLKIIKQMKVGELKSLEYLHPHINVENRLASYMTQWPTSLTSIISEDIEKSTLYTLRLKIIQRYLELVLDLTNDEFYRGVTTYPTIKHRPLEHINETLKILQLQIMIPNHKIKSNLYLIHVDPENLKNIIHNFRSIGGIDIKEIIRMHPKLALRNCSTLVEIRNILEEYGISSEAQRRCFGIYTLAPETVRERIETAKNIPEFSTFINHPRFLKMIYYNTKAIKRLNKLYSSNKKCVSLNVLSGSSAHYEVFEKAPGDRLGKGKDLLFWISQSFGKKFNVTHIRNLIKRHPYWINTPVLQVKSVYDHLSIKFSDQDIYENCPILLYPWKKICAALNVIEKKITQEQIPTVQENFSYQALSKSQKLSLVLYLLEKKHYFSGNGVWAEEKNKGSDKLEEKKVLSSQL
ncbi:hypothetical protein HF086_001264 [Spodoptera exigua]|uniref:Transcription termination factor 5, mitochondrial n=1 Tax=Spodoptera exigua TaxID=7107 RepID=A0A922MBW6_SPOEX|nr:hypothetical protein HF086_001264 [Spodoptera exigua]